MKLEEVLRKIDELIVRHEMLIFLEGNGYYHEGALDALEELREAIKQKGGEE